MAGLVGDPARFWDELWSKNTAFFKSKRKALALASLNRDLARIIETANGHQKKGRKSGDRMYIALWAEADKKINTFCAAHSIERVEIETQAPALHELRELTHGHPQVPRVIVVIVGLLAALMLAWIIGAASGFVAAGFHFVVRHIQ